MLWTRGWPSTLCCRCQAQGRRRDDGRARAGGRARDDGGCIKTARSLTEEARRAAGRPRPFAPRGALGRHAGQVPVSITTGRVSKHYWTTSRTGPTRRYSPSRAHGQERNVAKASKAVGPAGPEAFAASCRASLSETIASCDELLSKFFPEDTTDVNAVGDGAGITAHGTGGTTVSGGS